MEWKADHTRDSEIWLYAIGAGYLREKQGARAVDLFWYAAGHAQGRGKKERAVLYEEVKYS